jgi:excinuclease ABC subunit A
VLVIEHNLDVIKTADWIIDMGPEGGAAGGDIIATGTPEDVAKIARSYTGQFVKPLLERAPRVTASARTKRGGSGSRGVQPAAAPRD